MSHITLKNTKLGTVNCTLHCDSFSAVDSYIEEAYSETLDRALTEKELERFNEKYMAEVQDYSYREGGSRNHN